MRKIREFVDLIAVCLMLSLSACHAPIGPEELTLEEYFNHVENRYTTESLDCGTSEQIGFGFDYSNPEVVTCLHNAFANGQSAHGYFTSKSVHGKVNLHWLGYSLSNGNIEKNSYSKFLDAPEDEENFFFTNTCDIPSIIAAPTSVLHLFKCN